MKRLRKRKGSLDSELDTDVDSFSLKKPRLYSESGMETPEEASDEDKRSHVERVLRIMEKEQLVDFVLNVMSQSLETRQLVTASLPKPTLDLVGNMLQHLEKKLSNSFPYNKWGIDRSDYSWNRVKPVLLEIKETCLHYLDHFTNPRLCPADFQHEYPSNAFGYLHIATSLVHRLPEWDSEHHNIETKHEPYRRIAAAWRNVTAEVGRRFREEGKVFGLSSLSDWGKSLEQHNQQVKGLFGFAEALEEFNMQFGWMAR